MRVMKPAVLNRHPCVKPLKRINTVSYTIIDQFFVLGISIRLSQTGLASHGVVKYAIAFSRVQFVYVLMMLGNARRNILCCGAMTAFFRTPQTV